MTDTITRKSEPNELGTSPESEQFEVTWRARFAEFADESDDDAGIAGWSCSGLEARVRRFAGLWIPPPERARWLDAGCGAGTYARMLSRCGLDVVGADYSFPTLLKAKLRGIEPIAYATADVRHLPFRSASFDGVLCFGVTQALTQSDDAVRSLVAVVKPGGQVWIDALNRWCVANAITIARRRLKREPMHLRYESPTTMKRLLRSQGLQRVRLHWLPILPSRLQRLQPWIESKLARWIFRFVPLIGILISHSFIVSGERSAPGR
jgi:ubiquinone/menaquinone biosynthesis C-methylase UbiE